MNPSAPDYLNNRRYRIIGAGSREERRANVRECLKHGFPQMKRVPLHDERMSLVCFGPSLKYTWSQVRKPFTTVSGAHDYMISGGLIPDYHVEADPRKHKTHFTKNSHPEVDYLMASCCHPDMWSNFKDRKVHIWHLIESKEMIDELEKEDPGSLKVSVGSNVGMAAIEVLGNLGYRKYDIYGMDFSFDATRHAGFHPNEIEDEILVTLDGRDFRTTRQLFEGAREFIQLISSYDCEWRVHGDGLLQQMLTTVKSLTRRVA